MKSVEGEIDCGGNAAAEEQKEISAEEKDQRLSFVGNSPQDGMEEQPFDQDQRTEATAEPSAKSSTLGFTSLDPEKFFKLVAESQSRRMDDQRVSANFLPGIEIFSSRGSALMNKLETDQLCKFVIRAQSSRMEDQRCTPPQIILTPESPVTSRKSFSRPPSPTQDPDPLSRHPPRSASFSPLSDREKMQTDNIPIQMLSPAEQEHLLSLVCQALRGRMEDQRCYLDPSMRTSAPQGITSIVPQGIDPEQFFKLVSKIQSQRLDDQRVALNFLPGIQTPSSDTQPLLAAEDKERFYNIVAQVQSKRMDEQRCHAPHIQLGTPSPIRKVWTEPGFTKEDPPGRQSSSKASRRSSASISTPSETYWHQNNSNHIAQVPVSTDKEQYFSMVHQAQRWLEDQQHAFNPNALSTEQFFSLVANSQSKRMDDQRTTMPPSQTEKTSIPQIILTPGSPAAPRAASSRRASLTQDPDSASRPPPRSASFSPVSDKERMQYDSNISTKLTFQVSVCLTPPCKGCTADCQQGFYPDVFLTVGPPGGEGFVLPLTPTVCGPTSLEATPRSTRHHSRSSSPHRSHSRSAQPRSSSLNPAPMACPISSDEDYFSLIQRVHTAQLQQGHATEKSKEAGKGRGKGDGKKERKDRVKKK